MIASHYAEPLERTVKESVQLVDAPKAEALVIVAGAPGSVIRILDDSRGWAWGYGPDGTVGYLTSSALR